MFRKKKKEKKIMSDQSLCSLVYVKQIYTDPFSIVWSRPDVMIAKVINI